MEFVLQGNKIKIVKYKILHNGITRNIFNDDELTKLKVKLDEKGITYTVETLENTEAELAFNGTTADTYEQALEKINGTYIESESDIEILQSAVLELASMIAGGVNNG